MMLFLVYLVYLCEQTSAVIYRLNDSDYYKMPSIFHLDDYEECVHQPDWVYCSVEMLLVSDEPSPLLQQIQEYSEHKSKHFNYTKLQYGVCVQSTCSKYINEQNKNDLTPAIEACYNDSIWQKHKLKVKIIDVQCSNSKDKVDVEMSDVFVAIVFGIIIAVNVVGSFYDIFEKRIQNKQGKNIFMSFSMLANSKNLFFIEQNRYCYKQETSFKGFNGIRYLSLMLIVLGHSPLGFVTNVDNPRFIEQMYDNIFWYLLFNGTLIVQTFFILTSFFLASKLLTISKQRITWNLPLKIILLRYIRLTPSYAIVLAFEATLIKFMKGGPLWWNVVDSEVRGCRQHWWFHILYMNNYLAKSQCLPQTWYLAADMQLFVVGVFVCGLIKKPFVRNVTLTLLFFGGILMTAIHTYIQNLNGYLLITPESSRTLFMEDETYHYVYRTGHTNVVCFVMGLAMGYLVYTLQKKKFDILHYKKYVVVYWATVPSIIGLLLLGNVFYTDTQRAPLAATVLYAAAVKPIFGLIIVTIVLGFVFKIENVYRNVLEWTVWVPLARLSYSVFLMHVIVIRTVAATHTTLMHCSLYGILSYGIGMIAVTHVAAFPLWLMVEAPVSNLLKLFLVEHDTVEIEQQEPTDESSTNHVIFLLAPSRRTRSLHDTSHWRLNEQPERDSTHVRHKYCRHKHYHLK